MASQTALNVQRANMRQSKLKQRLNDRARFGNAELEVDRSKVWDMVVEEMTQLPRRYREPLEQCLLHGQSHREAATELGSSRTSVQYRIERGQEFLRERLNSRGVVFTTGCGLLGSLAFRARDGGASR